MMKKTFYSILFSGWALCIIIPLSTYNLEIVALKMVMALLWWLCLYVGLCLDCHLFSPFTLFGTYPLAIMIYSDYISDKYLPLPDAAGATVLALAGSCVFMGMWVMRVYACKAKRYGKFLPPESEPDYSTWPLLLFFLIPFAMVLLSNDIGDYSSKDDVAELRAQSGIAVWGMFFAFYAPIIINAVRKRQHAMLLLMFGMLFALSLFSMSKGTIINALLALVLAAEAYRKDAIKEKWSIRKMLLVTFVFVVVIAAFRFYGALRNGKFGDDDYMTSYDYAVRYHAIRPLPKGLQALYSPYMYMVTPSSNVTHLVECGFNNGNGIATFWPMLSVFQLKRLFNISFPAVPVRLLPYNTFSVGGVFYFDGGWPAVGVGCFLLGLATCWLYTRSRDSQDVMILSEYFFWGLAMFYSFFSNHFITQGYPLRMLIVLEIYRWLCLSSNRVSREELKAKVC